jgi:hypothetical protein
MAAEGEPKRLDRRVAWTVKVAGAGALLVGVLGAEKLIVPGAVAAGAGWGYEKATDPNRKSKTKSSGTVFQRAKEIYWPGGRKAA